VGCGSGHWLGQAAAAGWDGCGVDTDPVAVTKARAAGLDVRLGPIEAWSDDPCSFDAVTISHVIEHVSDPAALLKQAFLLLRPGGSLYIDTPNIDAPTHSEFGRSWRGLEAPRHLVLFSERCLIGLLTQQGFVDIARHCPPGIETFLVEASRQIQVLDGSGSARRPATLPIHGAPEFLTLTCYRP